jgi:hypothetical protein
MNIKKEKEDELFKEDALFDAFTEYWKNDWKNTRRSRTSGRIQIGDSKFYLIKSSASFNSSRAYIYGTHHWMVYKLNDEYDMSNFSMDFAMHRGWKEDYSIRGEFQLDDISNIKKRRAFIERDFFKQGSKVA